MTKCECSNSNSVCRMQNKSTLLLLLKLPKKFNKKYLNSKELYTIIAHSSETKMNSSQDHLQPYP